MIYETFECMIGSSHESKGVMRDASVTFPLCLGADDAVLQFGGSWPETVASRSRAVALGIRTVRCIYCCPNQISFFTRAACHCFHRLLPGHHKEG